jgi:hypothetical protein
MGFTRFDAALIAIWKGRYQYLNNGSEGCRWIWTALNKIV